jgi:hypothetical protein
VTITAQGPNLLIQGTSLAGTAWKASLRISGLGCTIFHANLDNNGQQDLVIYSPGITDQGAYGTSLSILLFDKSGDPFPWQATGRFTLVKEGIQEIRRDAKGVVIMQTSELGLPAWGGISFVSYLYRLADTRVIASQESFEGIDFPHVVAASQGDPKITRSANAINLSTNMVALDSNSPVQNADAMFMRYGAESSSAVAASTMSSAKSNPITNPTIDANALSNAGEHMIVSDGSKLDLPDILVVDNARGARHIVFHPEDTDVKQLAGKKYRIHPTGLNCSDPDDCHPFIVWAK